MKNMLFYTISIVLLMAASASLMANQAAIGAGAGSGSTESYAKVGMSGGQFLKIGHGARGNGMAGAVSALSNDLASVFWNPAGIADIPSFSAEFDHTAWFADLSHNFASIGMPVMDAFAFSLHFTSVSTPEMERSTLEKPNGLNSYFSASDVSIGATFAGYLTEQFSFGITGRYLDNSIGDANSAGFAFDVGTKYKTGIQGIVLGVSLHGLTTELTYSGNEFNRTIKLLSSQWGSQTDVNLVPSAYNIPLVFRANVAADIIRLEEHTLVGALDFTTNSDSPEQFALGAEYIWNNLLALRAGYRIGHDVQGVSIGAGVQYFLSSLSGKVDYAFSPLAYDLGFAHRVSISIDLGR